MAGSSLPRCCWTVFTAVALLQICAAVDLPEDPLIEVAPGYRAAYNETAGSFRIFPDSNVKSEMNYQYFSERIDFETFEDSILIGAADKLYMLSLNLSKESELSWVSDVAHTESCEMENSQDERDYLCRNHIRLYHRVPFEDDLLYVCGTQSAVLPQCRSVNLANGYLGEAGVPSDASSGLISAHPDYPNHGTFRNLSLNDENFVTWSHDTTSTFPFSFTEQNVSFNNSNSEFSNFESFGTVSSWFDAPTYIVDMLHLSFDQTGFQFQNPAFNYDFYFVFLRERYQLELEGRLDTEPLILSRVVRICKDDPGVILDGSPVFSTLLKTRIYCDQESPGSNDNPLGAVNNRYNDIWSVALNGESGGRSYPSQNSYSIRKLYGAFSTPLTGPAGSAICIYAASASTNNRNQNRGLYDTFVDDITLAANTERTVENSYAHCDGNGRPVTDGTTLGAADTVVSRTMIQLGVNPLIVFDSIYITQMVVDEVCVVENNRSQCINQDVLFLGTSLGTIRKVVFIGETSPVVAEEIVLDNENYIRDLEIKEVNGVKHLFASTSSHVYRLSLERCGRHSNYTECVGSRDPYCVWNATSTAYGCQRNNLTANGELANTEVPNNIFQNVHTGVITGIPEVSLEMESYSFEEGDQIVINVVSSITLPDSWVVLVVLGTVSDPFPVVFSGGLNATVTIPFSSISDDDNVFTGVKNFTLWLKNTNMGNAVFPLREATLSIVDNDGAPVEIGLVGLDDQCSQWRVRISDEDLTDMNTIIENGIAKPNEIVQGLDVKMSNCQLFCQDDMSFSVSYRCTMTSDEPNVGTARLRMALRQWAMEEQTIKLGDDIEVMVSSSCTDIIPSSPCEVVEVSTAGLRDFSSGSAAAVVFALLLVVAVMVCVVLLVLLMVLYRRSRRRQCVTISKDTTDDPDTNGHHNNEAFGFQTKPSSSPREANGDQEDGLTSSHNSNDINPTSAAPLVHNGVAVKKNPFNFSLANPPLSRKNSPQVTDSPRRPRSRVDSKISVQSNENAIL